MEYSAAYSVVLKPPFHVKPGASFHAFIERRCSEPDNRDDDDNTADEDTNFPGPTLTAHTKQNFYNDEPIEVFPTITSVNSSITIRFKGVPNLGLVSIYWVLSDGSKLVVEENIQVEGTLYINAPIRQGLYRLMLIRQGGGGCYEIKNTPILVY